MGNETAGGKVSTIDTENELHDGMLGMEFSGSLVLRSLDLAVHWRVC